MRKFYSNRINLSKDQVAHLGDTGDTPHKCFICGVPALHVVKIFPLSNDKLPLCTLHFTRMFKLPPNRQPPKPRIKKVPVKLENSRTLLENSRTFRLRRHLKPTLTIHATRSACIPFYIPGNLAKSFFSLYNRTGSTKSYISLSVIMKGPNMQSLPLHLVESFTEEHPSSASIAINMLINSAIAHYPWLKDSRMLLEVSANKLFDFLPTEYLPMG